MALKYEWLKEQLSLLIRQSIRDGIHRLPTEQELCSTYGVSRQTVRAALALLEQEGVISKRRGSGSYITGLSAAPQENLIPILISEDQDYLYPGLLEDIRSRLSEGGFSSEVLVTEGSVARERDILSDLLCRPPRGMIAEPCRSALPNPNLDLYRRLIRVGCRPVFLGSSYPGLSGVLTVKDDNDSGSSLLVRHLASQGHRAMGAVLPWDDLRGQERYLGFSETLLSLGLPFQDSHVCWYSSGELRRLSPEEEVRVFRVIMTRLLSSCTAVICFDDRVAYRLAGAFRRAGYELPAAMAIASFDNTYLSSHSSLPLTSLAHRPHEMGRLTAETVIKTLNGIPVSLQESRWELIIRESTKLKR